MTASNRIAIVDLETTSADPATASIVEIAVCLWSVEHRIVESVFSTTVRATENPAEHVNGIPTAALTDATVQERAFASVGHFIAKADVIAAHNGDAFDRPILERLACPWVAPKPWLDTMDLEWPRACTSRALIQIAASHGVPIGTVHRAVDDVLLVARILERCTELGSDLPAMIAKAMRPKATFAVAATGFDEARNALAKANGFRWESAAREWRRTMAVDDAETLPFAVRQVT